MVSSAAFPEAHASRKSVTRGPARPGAFPGLASRRPIYLGHHTKLIGEGSMWKTLITLVVCLSLSPGAPFAAEAGAAGAHPITIGMQVPGAFSLFDSICDETAKEAKALGVTLKIARADWKVSKEASNIDGFVSQGVQGILVWSLLPDTAGPSIESATKAGVPVAAIGWTRSDQLLVHVTEDQTEEGRLAAEFFVNRLGNKGSILQLQGPAWYRSETKASFEKRLKNSNITIAASESAEPESSGVYTYPSASPGAIKTLTASLIQKSPDFDGIFAHGDVLTLGAVTALESLHIDTGKRVVVGFETIPGNVRALREGTLTAVIDARPVRRQGRRSGTSWPTSRTSRCHRRRLSR